MAPKGEKLFSFDTLFKGVLTLSFLVLGFFGQRLVNQGDRSQQEIADLKIQMGILQTKMDMLLGSSKAEIKTTSFKNN